MSHPNTLTKMSSYFNIFPILWPISPPQPVTKMLYFLLTIYSALKFLSNNGHQGQSSQFLVPIFQLDRE